MSKSFQVLPKLFLAGGLHLFAKLLLPAASDKQSLLLNWDVVLATKTSVPLSAAFSFLFSERPSRHGSCMVDILVLSENSKKLQLLRVPDFEDYPVAPALSPWHRFFKLHLDPFPSEGQRLKAQKSRKFCRALNIHQFGLKDQRRVGWNLPLGEWLARISFHQNANFLFRLFVRQGANFTVSICHLRRNFQSTLSTHTHSLDSFIPPDRSFTSMTFQFWRIKFYRFNAKPSWCQATQEWLVQLLARTGWACDDTLKSQKSTSVAMEKSVEKMMKERWSMGLWLSVLFRWATRYEVAQCSERTRCFQLRLHRRSQEPQFQQLRNVQSAASEDHTSSLYFSPDGKDIHSNARGWPVISVKPAHLLGGGSFQLQNKKHLKLYYIFIHLFLYIQYIHIYICMYI